jgi:predicted permease
MRHALSVAVFHFFLPALAFGLAASARMDRSFIAIPLTAAAITLSGVGVGLAVYRWLPWFREAPRPAVGVLVLAGAFGNVMYLGLPVITETVGADYGYVALLYDLLASTPVVLTVGLIVAARYGSGVPVPVSASIKRVLALPPLWGAAAGLAVHVAQIQLPKPLLEAVHLMGRAVVPVMIFTVGLALDFRDILRLPVALPALTLKLVVVPMAACALASALGMRGDVLTAVVIEGAMPVMVLALIIADEFNLDVNLAAMCITVSTVASFFTLPMMIKILL